MPVVTVNPAPIPIDSYGFEGGFVEQSDDTAVRAIYTAGQTASFMPSTRTSFTFPAPYNTKGWRITLPADGTVAHVGYSYWRRLSHDGDNLYIMIDVGGAMTLYKMVKSTGVVTKEGAIFPGGANPDPGTSELAYFSVTQPTKLYYLDGALGTKLKRIDVLTQSVSTVLDISTQTGLYGSNKYIWQAHSSFDDNVHVFSVADLSNQGDWLGIGVYIEGTTTYKYYPRSAMPPGVWGIDEGEVDASGTYVHSKDDTDGVNQWDSRFIRISDDNEVVLLDAAGGAGHSDVGYGYCVQDDNFFVGGHVSRLWNMGDSPAGPGTDVYRVANGKGSFSHLSHLNARNASASQQYALGSGATDDAGNDARTNEIIAFRLDGSKKTLVIAPVMTSMPSFNYNDLAFANICQYGRYAVWTTNLGTASGPLTAILVRVPTHVSATWDTYVDGDGHVKFR